VPPLVMNEPFPGAGIFLDELSIANIKKSKLPATFGRSYYNP
jgi:hypothetical protein